MKEVPLSSIDLPFSLDELSVCVTWVSLPSVLLIGISDLHVLMMLDHLVISIPPHECTSDGFVSRRSHASMHCSVNFFEDFAMNCPLFKR